MDNILDNIGVGGGKTLTNIPLWTCSSDVIGSNSTQTEWEVKCALNPYKLFVCLSISGKYDKNYSIGSKNWYQLPWNSF